MKLAIGSLLAVLAIVFVVLMSTSPTIAASSAPCGTGVQLPAGSKLASTEDGLMVTYPDGSIIVYDCGCSGSGSCSEVGSPTGVRCETTNCSNCTLSATLVEGPPETM